MPNPSTVFNKRPRKLWWLVGLVLFALLALLQMPAAWIVEKYAPQSPYIQQVSGNIWQGSVVWQLPQATTLLTGVMDWSWQPLSLFVGKMAVDVDITTGQTKLNGELARGLNHWQVQDMSGKIAPETLASIVNWQLPNTPIQLNNVSLNRQSATADNKAGFSEADGQLTWVGGEVGYPNAGQILYITIPTMRAQLSVEQKDNNQRLHLNLLNDQDKRLGDLYLDGDNLLDVSLTQRLLENMPKYQGQAPQDTPVVSVRQPLLTSLGTN